LSLAVAIPILGFALPHAAAMFTVSLGMVEQDGMVIVIGLLAGLASLAVAIASALTGRSLLAKAGEWLKSFIRKLGAKWAKNLLRKINSKWANLLDLRWSKLLLFWDPEAASKFDTPLPNLIPAAKTSRLGTMIERRRKASRVSTSYGVSGRRVDRPRAEPSSRVRHEKKQAI